MFHSMPKTVKQKGKKKCFLLTKTNYVLYHLAIFQYLWVNKHYSARRMQAPKKYMVISFAASIRKIVAAQNPTQGCNGWALRNSKGHCLHRLECQDAVDINHKLQGQMPWPRGFFSVSSFTAFQEPELPSCFYISIFSVLSELLLCSGHFSW